MNSSRTRPGSARRPVGEAPVEKIVTEAELRVKQLLEAQMESSVTVTSLQARYKQFAPAVLYDSRLAAISGTKSLSSYSTAVDGDQQLDELRQLGLSEDDIRVMLAGGTSEAGSTGRHLLNPDVAREQRERIREHVASRSRSLLNDSSSGGGSSPAAFSGATAVSRHTLQLERALGRGTRLATMTECLLREKQQQQSASVPHGSARCCSPPAGNNGTSGPIPTSTLTHPADLLRQIADELGSGKNSSSSSSSSSSRRKRRRKSPTKQCDGNECGRTSPAVDGRRQTRSDSVDSEHTNEPVDAQSHSSRVSPSAGLLEGPTLPQMTSPEHGACRPAPAAAYTYGPNERVDSTDGRDSTAEVEQTHDLVSVCGPIWLITDEEIVRNRLSVSELRALPHFAGYEPGTPNNVLYVKNLASSVRELDLVSLFNRFNSPTKAQIMYRLLVGRMKGQAFVTLPDVETATLALHTLNGYMFRGKPVVLSYGRKTSENVSLRTGHLSVAPSQEPVA